MGSKTSLSGLLFVFQALSLSLFISSSVSTSLYQLQHCPTFRCLQSLHMTACLKKINISAGKETKASIWCVYLCSSHGKECGVNVIYQYWSTLFLNFQGLFIFYFTKSLRQRKEKPRFVSDKIRGEVTVNDTAEQSLNFSKRLGPLNLQVPVSFCRQCLNIVAVLIQTPWLVLCHQRSCSCKKTSGGEKGSVICLSSVNNTVFHHVSSSW